MLKKSIRKVLTDPLTTNNSIHRVSLTVISVSLFGKARSYKFENIFKKYCRLH